jgi:hypothetical protein
MSTETQEIQSELPPIDARRDAVIERIRRALKTRSGKAWSVRGGRGTAWGWITIDAPPARRTWRYVETDETDERGMKVYKEVMDVPGPMGHTGPAEREELGRLLGLGPVHHQGVSIPASNAYYIEYVDRAEGREPRKIGTQYWD